MPVLTLWLSLLLFAASGAVLCAGYVKLIDPATAYVVFLGLFLFLAPVTLLVAIALWFKGVIRRNGILGRPWYY